MDKWTVWEEKKIEISQDDLSRLLTGVKMLAEGKRLPKQEHKDVWMLLHDRLAKLVEPEPKWLDE